MYHPTTRLLTILELLQARPSLSGAELATRLEVDRRTVRRYIMMLQDLGIPIDGERGPYGGYRLRPGYKLPPLMLTDDESLAITLSLVLAHRQGIPASPHTVEGLLAKIQRVLPADLRERVQAVQSVVSFSSTGMPPQPHGDTIMTVGAATAQLRQIELCYRSRDWDEETLRRFDPYGLVHHWERWYTVGWCHLRNAVRVFRLDRVVSAELTETTFTRPAEFNSLQYVLESLATTPWSWNVSVLLHTTLEAALDRMPRDVVALEAVEGGVRMRANVDRLEWLACMLLTLQCTFVVQEPPELRDALRTVAARATEMAERV